MQPFISQTFAHQARFIAAVGAALVVAWSVIEASESSRLLLSGLLILMAGSTPWASWRLRRTRHVERFVSPNVVRQIERCGMQAVAADAQTEISIVCADIRNFTRFSSAVESAEVMQLLREYYAAVGTVVAQFGGTVKDYAGDGILVLVGAPRSVTGHAGRAVNMAVALRDAAQEVTTRWSRAGLELDVGLGVASGEVTVGVLGGSERMEYAAVGPAVNLAARLCGKALGGQILMDERTRSLAGEQKRSVSLRAGAALTLKGIPAPVASFIV